MVCEQVWRPPRTCLRCRYAQATDETGCVEKKLTPHSFRHGQATFLLRASLNEAQVKAALGWSPNSRMLARYGHITNKDVHHARLKLHGLVPAEGPELEGIVDIMELPLAGSVVVEPVLPEPIVIDEKAVIDGLFERIMGAVRKELTQEQRMAFLREIDKIKG
ncbi:MAG: tyrosine-type recombinase/integrase [Thermoplasmata archaeon]